MTLEELQSYLISITPAFDFYTSELSRIENLSEPTQQDLDKLLMYQGLFSGINADYQYLIREIQRLGGEV